MEKFFLFGLVILISCFTGGEGQGHAGEQACNRVSNVEIRYKDYFEIYLGFNRTSQSIGKHGFFYNYIKAAVNDCCHFMDLNFTKLNSSEMEVEELALTAMPMSNDTAIPRPFVFYFPEFATNKEKIVYDFELHFVKLSRSPGQAIIMLKPESKEQVSLFHIFKESTPMLAMMLAMSWLVGILGWIADHWKNPEEFPSPFISGMFEGFWWAIVTMTTVGYGDKSPRSVPARVLAVIWVMMSAVFLSLFTANATSILNQSLQEEDYTETIGKKIGVLQSKQFDEFQLNLGAEVINFNNYYDMDKALTEGKIDRFLFPDYKDLIWLLDNIYKEGEEKFKIAKVFESPFQVGMVLSMLPEYISADDNLFLRCLRTGISARERWWKRALGYGSIAYPKEDKGDGTTALNQDNLLTTTCYILAAIAGLACFGIVWDLWKYHTKRKTDNSEEVEDIEPGKENVAMTVENVENKDTQHVKDDATWF